MKSDSSSLTDYQATGSHEKSFFSSNSLFVEAEKTERGYVQTNQDGTKHQFFEFDESNIFRIKSLNTFKNVDLETGKFKNHISGLTVEKIGCIGHNRQSSVLRVTISSDENPGFVKFRHGFSPGGIHLSGDVKIFLAAPVVNAITAEIESNTSALMISIMLNEKAFFSNADEQGGYSAPILDCFLPFLKDQKISLIERKIIIDEVAHISEEISIEWCFTLSQLTIFPESYDDGWAPGKRNLVKDDQQNHPLKEDFSKLLNLSDSFIRSTEMFLISVQRLAKSSKRYFLLLCLLLVVLKLLK
jgi:hypothetical protein